MAKLNWAETKNAYKSILNRNAILVILFNVVNTYNMFMKNAFRVMVVKTDLGMAPSTIVVLASVFSLVGFIFRVPIGSLFDNKRNKLKLYLSAAIILRIVTYIVGFGMASSTIGIYTTYIVDAIAWSFIGVATPALLAISIDKKAIGSGYALFQGLASIASGTAASFALSLYNDHGKMVASLVAAGIAAISLVLVLLLDSKKLSESFEQAKNAENEAKKKESSTGAVLDSGNKGFLRKLIKGVSVAAIPIALVFALPSIGMGLQSSYLPLMAADGGYDYLAAQSLGNTLTGIMSVAIGFLCDFINPAILAFVSLIVTTFRFFSLGYLHTTAMLNSTLIICGIFYFYQTPLRIMAVRMTPSNEQGALSATILLLQDICMIFGGLPFGVVADKMGYSATFIGMGYVMVLTCVIFLVVLIRGRKKANAATVALNKESPGSAT